MKNKLLNTYSIYVNDEGNLVQVKRLSLGFIRCVYYNTNHEFTCVAYNLKYKVSPKTHPELFL